MIMGKRDTKDLHRFLKPFTSDMKKRALWLRSFVWDLYPTSNEIIYDNYNALAFGWSITDRVSHLFCNVAVGRTSGNIHFGFYWGAKLSDPKKLLLGQGNQYRYILVNDTDDFPKAYMIKLMQQAYEYSAAKVKDKDQLMKGKTITKSISAAKRIKKAKSPSKKVTRKKVRSGGPRRTGM